MTTRYEGADSKITSVSVLQAGEEIGVDEVPEGEMALVFSHDEVFYVTGTAEDLRELLEDALQAVKEAEGK